ncbi:MAG: hypothetical protein CMP47_12465 [Rickettsiales bacterium]|nr:hypothetical protein [Rickettsiales bacterium]|tara:strand:+ start:1257 stop:1514 length:258 start_codon:yes stop_codon:yes gene_type:complete
MGKAKRGKNIGFVKEVAKKKPNLQHVLDNLDQLSVDEINASKIPGWTKQVLVKEKEEQALRPPGALTPEEIAQRMIDHSLDKSKE